MRIRPAAVFAITALLVPAAAHARAGVPVETSYSGRNFTGIENDGEARELLREKMGEAISQKLKEYGFGADVIAKLAANADYRYDEIDDRKADILQDGRTKTVTLYNIAGKVTAFVTPGDVKTLYSALKSLGLSTMEEVTAFRDCLRLFSTLSPEEGDVVSLKYMLSKAWYPREQQAIESAMNAAGGDYDSIAGSYSRLSHEVVAYESETGDREGAKSLRAVLDAMTVRGIQTAQLDSSSSVTAMAAVEMMGREGGGAELKKRLYEILEFRWRNQIFTLASSPDYSIRKLSAEVDAFNNAFPGSKVAQESRRKLESAMVAYFTKYAPPDGAALADYADIYADFVRRYPSSRSMNAVSDAVTSRCAGMLSMARALNDDEYAAFQKAFEACLLASGGRPEFRRIEEAKPGFEAANKRRIEREMLGGAAVVIDWLDALAEAGLGKGAIFRQSGSKLAYLWDSGAPGKGCSCGLVSGAPCRDYNPVRVEARWSAGAEEIGICKVPLPPSHRAVLYRSVATRGKMISNPAQIERFINGTGQDSIEALFGPARVAVEAYGNECSAKIANSRSAAAVAEEGAAGERAGRGDKAKLKAGSCVRWGCDMTECRYQGRIKAKRGQGFVVTITRAPKTTEFNKNVTMDGKDLEACEQ